jgi:hypothetical protein
MLVASSLMLACNWCMQEPGSQESLADSACHPRLQVSRHLSGMPLGSPEKTKGKAADVSDALFEHS